MKLDFVNNGQEFEVPRLTTRKQIMILRYMDDLVKKNKDICYAEKIFNEWAVQIATLLQPIDKTVTVEKLMDLFDYDELGHLLLMIRGKAVNLYTCPGCGKQYPFSELLEHRNETSTGSGETNFQSSPESDTTGMNTGT